MLSWIREKFGKTVIGLIVGLLALVFVFYGVFSPKATRGIHEGAVAGTVNGEPISIDEFERAYRRQLDFFKNMMGGQNISEQQMKAFHIRESVFNELVRRKVMIQEAEKQGNLPADEEVRDQIRQIPAFQKDGKFDISAYKQTLEANNYTPASFEQMLRDDLAVQRWENYFRDRVNVSDDEVKVEFLTTNNKRNIKFVLLTADVGKKDVKIDPAEVQKYLADTAHLNLAKSQFEAKKDKDYKGKNFDAVKEQIAHDLIASGKTDEIKKVNEQIAQKVQAVLTADKASDAQVNKILKPYGVEVKVTGLMNSETPYLPGFGNAKDLLADTFADKSPIDPAQGGKAKTYSSPSWVAVAVVSESQKPDMSKLDTDRPSLMKQITARKERDLFESWIKKAVDKSKVDTNVAVVNSDAEGT
jgi:parvulin-like peptidyl-prolyl isomerase